MKPMVDERILRCVEISSDPREIRATYNKEIVTYNYPKNDRGYCFKAMRRTDGTLMVNPDGDAGLVCFCKGEIPDDHTHFVIDRVHPDGKWCIVTAIVGSKRDLLGAVKTPVEMKEELTERYMRVFANMRDEDFFEVIRGRLPNSGEYGEYVNDLLDLIEEINVSLDRFGEQLKERIMARENPKERELFSKIVQKMYDTRSDIINAVAKL